MKPTPRRARRFSFAASVELTDLETDAPVRGLATNLSLYGCHVDSTTSLPIGSKVKISIVHRGVHFVALGRVANARPPFGTGITFTRIEPANQLILDKWISELRSR